MNIEKTGSKVFVDFDNILDLVEYVELVPECNYSKSHSSDEWAGGTFNDAVTQARTGNPELCKKLFDDVKILEALIQEEKIGELRDVTGEYFDIGDVLSGEPECWRRDEYGPQKPVIPIYASFSMHSGVSPQIILNRGAAIVSLVDELEQNGFIVDLHLEDSSFYGGKNYHFSVKVKTDPIDLDTVAFVLANPLCLRRLDFAVIERITDKGICGSYGSPINYDANRILADSDLSGFYFCCSSGQQFEKHNYRTLEAAKDHIMKMLEDFKNNAAQIIIG